MSIANPTLPSFGLDPAAFRERGYTIVRELFDAEEVRRLRSNALETVADAERDGSVDTFAGREGTARSCIGDILSLPLLRHVLLDPRVVGVVTELLEGEPVYFGDGGFSVGKTGIRGWHRDNVNRRRLRGGLDWSDPYPLLRCALYLQDSSHHSGGLALRPGSSRLGFIRPTLPKLVDSHPGDMVVWTLRTVHSGEVVRLRGLPGLPLHPLLQTRLPRGLRVGDGEERIMIGLTFGREGGQLDYYIDYLKYRDMGAGWGSCRFGPEVWRQAEQVGLRVLRPVPEYGLAPDEAE